MVSGEVTILNPSGLHARPASILTKIASGFKSEVTIIYQDKTVLAKKIMSVLTAGIKYGAIVTVTCDGVDEKEALKAVLKGICEGLGEEVL